MSLYPAVPFPASPAAVPAGWPAHLAGAGIVAVRVADLACLLRRPLREGDRTALTAAGAGTIRAGDLVVFLKPVAVAPAVVRRDGKVQAGGQYDYRAIEIGDLRLGSVDASVTRMPDTPGNRAEFGSAGTADDSAPYPQLRDLPVTDASTRGLLAVVTGPSGGDKAVAEQALLDRALTEYAYVFTKSRLWVMDRNFPGVARIARMITVTHVLIRLKSDITVTKLGGFLPDGSYLADIRGKDGKIPMRVIEYDVHVDGQDVPEMFCLITDLDDWEQYPAGVLPVAYKWRWDGSETALREAKSAIRGAGPWTGPIFRSRTPDLIRQEHAAWITDCELVRAAARQAARLAAPARKGRRAGQPVRPREISFTAARRAAVTTARNGAATASLPAALTAARHPRRPGQAPHRHRPGPAPRPQNQGPPGIPRHRTRHPDPQGPRQDHRLRPHRRLNPAPRQHRPPAR